MPELTECRRQRKATRNVSSSKPVEVTLGLERPEAEEVNVCGDFNQWSPTSLKMIRRPDNGRWQKRLTLPPGRYQYKFIVDGEWLHDPEAFENVPNQYGSLNSVLEVCQ